MSAAAGATRRRPAGRDEPKAGPPSLVRVAQEFRFADRPFVRDL